MIEILTGDCRQWLPLLPAGVIQCCVTSPPYFGLRDYGVAGQIGLEASVDRYVAELVAVFREVRRTLRDDGTLWLNLGDSYNAYNGNRGVASSRLQAREAVLPALPGGYGLTHKGLKPKDLIGIPWRVAFALQADGWYLRSDIIWAKGNPMPESVRDRPTRAHEYLFLFTKTPHYYYDIDAIREPHTSLAAPPGNKDRMVPGRLGTVQRAKAEQAFHPLGRNKRSWWPINTKPFKGAHFATFPPDLVRPCLQAGASLHGACATCGTPYRRVLERGEPAEDWKRACGADAHGEYLGQATKDYASARAQDASAVKARILANMREVRTAGWEPTCRCQSPVRPCFALDPFGGAGTVGVVAQELGLHCLLLELNPDYAALARRRIGERCPPEPIAVTSPE